MSQSVPRASRPGNHPAGQPGNWTDSQLRGHEHLREPGSQAANHGASQPNSHCRSTGEARTTIFQAESLMSFASMFSLMSFASMFFFLREITQISTEKTHPKKTHSQTAPRFGQVRPQKLRNFPCGNWCRAGALSGAGVAHECRA